MSDQISSDSETPVGIQKNLRNLAALLRSASHLDPQAQLSLASLLEELGSELASSGSISTRTAGLTDAVTEVARSLHERHPAGLLETARDQLKEAAIRAETEAPVATGVAYRLIEVLSSMGI